MIPELSTVLPYAIGALAALLLPRLGVKLPGGSPPPAPPSSPLLAVLLELLRQRVGEQRAPDPNEARALELIRELLSKERKPAP